MYVTERGEEDIRRRLPCPCLGRQAQNRRNRYGQTFIDTFYGAHVGLTPPNQRWDRDRFNYYGAEAAAKDLFEDGYCDMAIMLPVDLRDFYVNGFNTTELNATLKDLHPDKVILNGRFDPREDRKGWTGSKRIRAVSVQRGQALYGRMEWCLPRLFPQGRLRRSLSGGMPATGDPQHSCPQGTDDASPRL